MGGPHGRTAGLGAARRPALTRWYALVLAVLIGFAAQSVATQGHVHFNPVSAHAALKPLHRAPADNPATCPLCRDLAQAGHYLTPVAILLDPPAASLVWLGALLLAAWHARSRSHAWLSRGPPGRHQG